MDNVIFLDLAQVVDFQVLCRGAYSGGILNASLFVLFSVFSFKIHYSKCGFLIVLFRFSLSAWNGCIKFDFVLHGHDLHTHKILHWISERVSYSRHQYMAEQS